MSGQRCSEGKENPGQDSRLQRSKNTQQGSGGDKSWGFQTYLPIPTSITSPPLPLPWPPTSFDVIFH